MAGDIIGLLILSVAGGEAEVLDVGVVPEARRQGLGRALLTAAVDAAVAGGAARLVLEVAEDNQPAQALYASA
ncbi:MAG: GNAT family N-acetyltransferase, partial [Pseudomonadota bacterium]